MKPHIYFFRGQWRISQHGFQGIDTKYDASRPSFPEACHLAMLAAIHSGVWRA